MKKRITYISILMLSIIPTFINATTTKVSCGNIKGVPIKILELSNLAINILEVTVPVLIIIFGIVDFVKAISSQKEDEMKKAQSTFIKRLIYGALVFFVFVIELSKSRVPGELAAIISKYGSTPDMEKAGIDYAVRQINDLISNGFTHIHIYTMNKPRIAGAIMAGIER